MVLVLVGVGVWFLLLTLLVVCLYFRPTRRTNVVRARQGRWALVSEDGQRRRHTA